jgi:hypothetical protein
MASTYSSLHYHLVFGTKSREPWIVPAWRGRLHNQEEHHRLKSYREELDTMLQKAGIEYDPQYID